MNTHTTAFRLVASLALLWAVFAVAMEIWSGGFRDEALSHAIGVHCAHTASDDFSLMDRWECAAQARRTTGVDKLVAEGTMPVLVEKAQSIIIPVIVLIIPALFYQGIGRAFRRYARWVRGAKRP